MGSLTVTAHVKPLGPLADEGPRRVVHAWADEVKKDIAAEGVNRLRSFEMNKSGRATGRYRSGDPDVEPWPTTTSASARPGRLRAVAGRLE